MIEPTHASNNWDRSIHKFQFNYVIPCSNTKGRNEKSHALIGSLINEVYKELGTDTYVSQKQVVL